jgi:hypothetical protein
MSTCRGSLPPHDNCPHGDRCDWEGRPGRAEALARAATDLDRQLLAMATKGPAPSGSPFVPNRADRRRARRR